MERISYFHLSSVHEASENVVIVPWTVNFKFTDLNWKKLSSNAAMGFLSVALMLSILSVASTASAQKVGSSGSSVTNIQRCLQQLGYFQGPITGRFGSLTQTAVTKFQRANRLPAVGYVGPATQRTLQSQCQSRNSGSGEIRPGSRGSAVSKLQQDLRQLNIFNGPITGFYGEQTQQAVIRFQQAAGIRADGIVGTRTRQAIAIALNPNPNQPPAGGTGGDTSPNALNLGDSSPQVEELQRYLQQLGYFRVNPTGYFGPTTRDAVTRFQQDNGLVPNGIADSQTLATLGRVLGIGNPGCLSNRGDICLGENSQRVVILQQRLQEWGFFNANPNGLYGPATKDAVAQFQRYYGLNPTGFVDFQTWQALGLGSSGGPVSETPTNNNNRYVVVVPIQNNDTLNKVRQFVPQAVAASSRLGDYVNAGAFRDRSEAEKLSNALRDRGLDARVEYF
jgi:peptidoglycan hydrolase-like protein with peptidoglycan-binding domain